jgi:O-antigen/teichoic acid export membrane protein
VGGAISLAVTAVVIVRRFGGLQPRVDWPLWRATARETLPITIWLILIQLGSRSDAILIGHWWPAAEAGRFHAASGVLASLNLVVAMTLAALYPALVRARAAGSEQDVRRLTLPLLVGGLALTTVVAMLAPLVIEPLLILLLGDRFVEAGPPLTVLRWALPALVVTGVAGAVLRSHGQDRALAWQALLGAVVSLTLNVTLIPAHGAIGAAASTLSAELAMAGFGVVLLRRNGLSTLQPATLGIAIGAAAGGTGLVAAHLAGQTWWLAALAGAAAAGAVLLTTALLVVGLRQDGRQTIGAAWSLMRRPSR